MQALRWILPLEVVGSCSGWTSTTALVRTEWLVVTAVRIACMTSSACSPLTRLGSTSWTTTNCSAAPDSGAIENTAPRPRNSPALVSCTVSSMSLG